MKLHAYIYIYIYSTYFYIFTHIYKYIRIKAIISLNTRECPEKNGPPCSQSAQDSSSEKFLLVDVKGVDYNLYDLDVATKETLIEAPSAEEFFYIGNLREAAINNFLQHTNVSYFVLS